MPQPFDVAQPEPRKRIPLYGQGAGARPRPELLHCKVAQRARFSYSSVGSSSKEKGEGVNSTLVQTKVALNTAVGQSSKHIKKRIKNPIVAAAS